MLKISKINTRDAVSYHPDGSIYVDIEFSTDQEFASELNSLAPAIIVRDAKEYSSYIESANLITSSSDGAQIFGVRDPSPFDTGLMKRGLILGLDKLTRDGDVYSYKEYVANCYITRACLVQLAEMKDHIDTHGDSEAGFRSGEAIEDLVGILETLDRFWD